MLALTAAALSLPATAAGAVSAEVNLDGTAAGLTVPLPPRVTIGAPYTPCEAECLGGGGPGTAATLTFAPDPADTGIVSYRYLFSSEDTWSTVSGETATLTYVPQQAGLHSLYVQAVDGTGWGGSSTRFVFKVANGEATVGRWHFDEASGPAVDSGTATGTTRNDATLSGGATRDDRGRRGVRTHGEWDEPLPDPVTDRGLVLDGSSGYAATDGPVLDTRGSYTLSAWVRPDTLGTTNRTVLAQDGGFRLAYDATRGTWTFGPSPSEDADQPALAAKHRARPGVWTHLAAVYDASADETRLYVNGRPQATGPAPGTGATDGPLQFGRAPADGSPTEYADHFDGSLDEVAVWRRPLTDGEIATEARVDEGYGRNGMELVADWSADGASGTVLTDTVSGYGPRLTLSGGAGLDGRTLTLDGVDGAATAGGPLVDGTGSFTVSTEVTLDGTEVATWDVGRVGYVFGWRAADGSTWGLWYEAAGLTTAFDPDTLEEILVPTGFWKFGRRNADGTHNAATSSEVARTNEPLRLTGVHDAQAGTVEFYIGKDRNGSPLSVPEPTGSGTFTIGGSLNGDTWTHHLPARVKDVKVWAGAVGSLQQLSDITAS
ncbi:LamG domain-containing protein [Streptomyces sp. NPDC018947]|uniref:LamG domain-containing protein n=1 Tax=Streptomyces sp. NPDC018947 TaxID=3365054 RepID=UPI00379F1596